MGRIHINNFQTTLSADIDDTTTTVTITSATGLPVLGVGEYYHLTLQYGNIYEIIKVTARTGTTLTVVRGQENTSAVSWTALSIVSLRATADSVDRKVDGDSSSTDTAIALFDGTTGKIIKNSLVTIGTSGNITSPVDASINSILLGRGNNSVSTNTCVGVSTLASVTSGASATAIGYQALSALTSGSNNTAIGRGALASMTTGAANTAIGRLALNGAVSGGNNVAIGSNSLSDAGFTGNGNTAIGSSALSLLTGTENNNVAIGGSAMAAATGSNSCVALGQSSMSSLTTGDQNLALGYNAAPTLTTGSTNVLMGYQADVDASDASGVIAIGANSIATKATGSGSSDNGPGIAIGSSSDKVGFRGDGTIYPSAGSSSGYWRVRINGTQYRILLFADS